MKTVVILNDKDNVATCLRELEAGAEVPLDGGRKALRARDAIAFGHKIAIAAIAPGEPVLKYGETIGIATVAIERGAWVHVHNVESVRARGDKRTVEAGSGG